MSEIIAWQYIDLYDIIILYNINIIYIPYCNFDAIPIQIDLQPVLRTTDHLKSFKHFEFITSVALAYPSRSFVIKWPPSTVAWYAVAKIIKIMPLFEGRCGINYAERVRGNLLSTHFIKITHMYPIQVSIYQQYFSSFLLLLQANLQ